MSLTVKIQILDFHSIEIGVFNIILSFVCFIKLLLLLRSLPIAELFRLPKDIKDADEVGDYLGDVLEALEILSDLTDANFDDKVVDAISAVLNDEEAWKAIHEVFVVLFLAKEDDYVNVACPPAVQHIAEEFGFNPILIISIVQGIITLLRLFAKEK